MNQKDKSAFRKKLERAATAVGRRIGANEVDVFFMDLIEFPLDVVLKAIEKALRDRDPEDMYIITKLLTVNEIRGAARKVMAAPRSKRSGCEKCEGTTWILPEPEPPPKDDSEKKKRKRYQEPARRCECWFAAIDSKEKGGEK